MDTFVTLEQQIDAFKAQITKLEAATDLQLVQRKLDTFMEEVRLLHIGFLSTLKGMIKELNAEGVKRYNGAVTKVNDNVNKQFEKLKNELRS